jgi:hypothetical protein
MGFELAGVSWSEFAAGTLRAQPLKLSAFVPLLKIYIASFASSHIVNDHFVDA